MISYENHFKDIKNKIRSSIIKIEVHWNAQVHYRVPPYF